MRAGHEGGGGGGSAGGAHAGGGGSAEARAMKREWARYEAMLAAIQDPASPEALVARRAHRRLADIAAELKLGASGVVELANQARRSACVLSYCALFRCLASAVERLHGAGGLDDFLWLPVWQLAVSLFLRGW